MFLLGYSLGEVIEENAAYVYTVDKNASAF